MSRERDLLKGIMSHFAACEASVSNASLGDLAETLYEIQDLLDQPEPEPDAWMLIDKETGARIPRAYKPECEPNKDRWEMYPLYASPPQKWEPLIDKRKQEIINRAMVQALLEDEWISRLDKGIEIALGIGGE